MTDTARLEELARQLCVDSIRATSAAGSGHPTSSMSAAHLTAVLFSNHLRYDPENPDHAGNDHFVISKGHASPLLYSLYKALGVIDDDQLLSLREMGSPLEGHPAPVEGLPWVEVATGSLGQGLPIGLGMALGLRLRGLPGRVWVLLGDSEMAEGSVWEAMANASHHQVDNLIGILDMNRLGQRGPTMLGWDGDAYVARAEAFGWQSIQVDGHDVAAIDDAYELAAGADRPTLVVAKTVKGWGVSFLENQDGHHGKAVSKDQTDQAIKELGGRRSLNVVPPDPPEAAVSSEEAASYQRPTFSDPIATRKAFGQALAALAPSRPDLVVLDGEVSNSTYTEAFEEVEAERFLEMYIAEQCMVGAAVGLQAVGLTPVAATFAAFLTRAYDFVRMAAVSRADVALSGSHAGVSIGEDGPSQMGLEDLAMMRAVHGSTVLYPADGNATVSLVGQMLDRPGVSYLRTTREDTPQLYGPDEELPIGGSKTLRAGDDDRATIIGAGVTLFEALKAAESLSEDEISVRVVDAYSIKPIDEETIRQAIRETGLLVVVEDHWIEGGLGDAVLAALTSDGSPLTGKVVKLAVTDMPGSGTPEEMREWAGISASRIVEAVEKNL